jgi:hypothetical protein
MSLQKSAQHSIICTKNLGHSNPEGSHWHGEKLAAVGKGLRADRLTCFT